MRYPPRPQVILFDLGGVLIELPPMTTMMVGCSLGESEIRRRWLVSAAVRDFEAGRITPDVFAARMVRDFELTEPPGRFLDRFAAWPGGFFGGAESLIERAGDEARVALLSNTNELHWSRFEQELALPTRFDAHFASHHVGMLKPDVEIFEHVASALGVEPGNILFFDDNIPNIDAAKAAGFEAYLARGPVDVNARLDLLVG